MPLVIDLSSRSRITVSGSAADFLNNICSADIRQLKEGEGSRSAFLDRFGKVIAVSSIYNLGGFFIVESDMAVHQKLIAYLDDLADLVGCKIGDMQKTHKQFSVLGFKKGSLGIDIEKGHAMSKAFNGIEIQIASNCLMERVDFFVPTENSDGFTEFLLMNAGAELIGESGYDAFRVDAGLPEFGKDYDNSYTVLELGIDSLVSYTKGCYTGQEIVARMKSHGGQLPKKIVKLNTNQIKQINPGEKLFAGGHVAGFVTSVGKGFCLATIKKGFFDAGTFLETAGKGKVSIVLA